MSNREPARAGVLQGTLDLMVLQTLDSLGPRMATRLRVGWSRSPAGRSGSIWGTLYPALMRLEQRGLLRGTWGTTDNNRRARFYSLKPAGRRHLTREKDAWDRMAVIMRTLMRGEA